MRKEIYEQPKAVADTLLGRHDAERRPAPGRDADRPGRAAGGSTRSSSSPAVRRSTPGMVAKYAIEHWTRIPCEVELASEFRYRDPIVGPSTLVVAISQSGETADTLMAIRHAREQKARVLAICNTNGVDDPARVRRGDLHPRRPGDRGGVDQGFPDPAGRLLPARSVPGPGPGHQVRRRDRGHRSTSWQTMPAAIARAAGRHGPGAEAGRRLRRRAVGAVPRPSRRLPGGTGGRAEAQGARLHPRRGLRRR